MTLFFVVTFFLAWLNKSPGDSGLQQDAQIQQAETATEWWKDSEASEAAPSADADAAEMSSESSGDVSADSASH